MAENRRDFLKRAGGTTAALGLPLSVANASASSRPEDPPATRRRRRTGSGLFLDLAGQPVGPVGSDSSGGFAFATVATERLGPDQVVKKHLANLEYADITLTVGAGMSPALYAWLQRMLETRRNGALVTVDGERRRRRELRFFNAVVREVVFPAVDLACDEAVALTVRIAPELTRDEAGSGEVLSWPAAPEARWLASNFRLRIDGLEDSTSKAHRVEAMPLRAVRGDNAVGDDRDYDRERYLDVPNLVFTVPEAEASSLVAWTHSFLVQGNCGDDQEKGGTLEYLSDLGQVLFTLRFGHLGVFRLAPMRAEGVHLLKAEMYCETLGFEF